MSDDANSKEEHYNRQNNGVCTLVVRYMTVHLFLGCSNILKAFIFQDQSADVYNNVFSHSAYSKTVNSNTREPLENHHLVLWQ